MKSNILGISAYYHDSAAALLRDGEIVAAVQEERFSRKKHDARFPAQSIGYCLAAANLALTELDYVVFYEKPLVKFERLLETYLSYAPKGLKSFIAAMPVWLKEKLYLKITLKNELSALGNCSITQLPHLLFSEHHYSHAASAFYPSGYPQAAVLCLDGVGEWATSSAWHGKHNSLDLLWEINFPHSLGLLYSAFTYYTGFKVNSGEYKLMGLAPYGKPRYVNLILDNLIDIKADGTFHLNMTYFNYATGLTMTNRKFNRLFGSAPRKPESGLSQRDMDIAASIQTVTEEVVLRLCRTLCHETGSDYLCMAGGVALNCVAMGRVLREGPFKDVWAQPAAGDAGGALGAALACWYEYLGNPRKSGSTDSMRGSYLGPAYSDQEIQSYLDSVAAKYQKLDDEELMPRLVQALNQESVIGWFQGRMEFGPRALGARSIIGDPRSQTMQSMMNLKIKYRESFRPFAPAVLEEQVANYFELDRPSPYMMMVAPVAKNQRLVLSDDHKVLCGMERLKAKRSHIPAVTHVDYSARVQTVHSNTNPKFYRLLKTFEEYTACPLVVNTSFNVRGEPIVNTPEDAYRCFMRTGMDYLVLEGFLLDKKQQPELKQDDSFRQAFELD